MELVVLIGLDLHILSPSLFTLLVMLTIITTLMTGPLLHWLRQRSLVGVRIECELAEPLVQQLHIQNSPGRRGPVPTRLSPKPPNRLHSARPYFRDRTPCHANPGWQRTARW